MIVVIVEKYKEVDANGIPTGYIKTGVSHGVDLDTLRTVVLPPASSAMELGAVWNDCINEWVLE
jgi:hypothetical protein